MLSKEKRLEFRSLFWFLFINFLLTAGLSYQYILYSSDLGRPLSKLFLHTALLSNFLLIYLILTLFLYSVFSFISFKRVFFVISAITISLFHILNLIDISIYRIFRIHINSMVLNLVFTEGAEDSLHLGLTTFLTFGLIITGVIFFEFFLINKLYTKLGDRIISKKIILILSSLIFLIVLSDKITFAVADLYNKKEVTRYSKVFPLYMDFTAKRFMQRHFGFKIDREDAIRIDNRSSTLNYPKEGLTSKGIESYPNIIWILLDAWRYDMLNEEVTPNIWEFCKDAIVFNNHYSGGNASRFGVFSLFYGIYGYYWHRFLGERRSPVFIDELINLNYDFKIISCTRLTNPEFRKTVFVKIPDKIIDRLEGENVAQKDRRLTNTFLNWLDNTDTERPFFSFLFYDAPHGPYNYPDDFEKYRPSNKSPNYMTIGRKDSLALKNSYKNAILFDDSEVGKILRAVREKKLLENTIILISGDHGEEFYESGFLGHTSAFSRQQTKVPLVLYIPGKKPMKIDYITSHLDVVPTMFELLGYSSKTDVYSQGQYLLNGKGHDFVVTAGWDDCALIDNDNFLIFSLETYNLAFFEVRDANYQIVANDRDILKTKRSNIMRVLKGFREFTK